MRPVHYRIHERLNVSFQLITDFPESSQFFFPRPGDRGRIGHAPMRALRCSGKNRALLSRFVTNGDDRREFLPGKFRDGFRALLRDVDSPLPHHVDRERVHAYRLCPGTKNLIPRPPHVTQQSLRHLAACRVSRTQNEHARLVFRCRHLPVLQEQQLGPQQAALLAGFTARTNALMNFPSICGPTVSGSSPAAARKSRASSAL